MPVLPLVWKEGEGYDIHLLRGGPASKSLINALDLPSGSSITTGLWFSPQFEGAPNAHFVEVDNLTGTVVAKLHTDPTKSKITNFLMTVSFVDALDPGGQEYRTEIRVHVHDSVMDIWLTPSTLTIHQDADECRFTVLARFNDSTVGDITDWPELTYQSDVPGHVKVLGSGILQAIAPGPSTIIATLDVSALGISKTSAPATAVAKPTWADVAAAANVIFVAGPVVPKKSDPGSSARDSVRSVVENATNVLFVAEGFPQALRGDFNNLVKVVAEELRTKEYLQPFTLLKHSVNYWSVFVPSDEDGVTVLGDYAFEARHLTAALVPRPLEPPASATEWSLEQMIHEVGLPVIEETETPWPAQHVERWKRFYGDKVTEARTRRFYLAWLNLALRSPVNERASAFGLAISDRPRASAGSRLPESLRADYRRTSTGSLMSFAQSLTYGGHPIGSTWQSGAENFGLVCFVCLSDQAAGQAALGRGYVTASFGMSRFARLKPVAGRGMDLLTAPPEKHSRTVFASLFAHESSHVLGLWDEYGDGRGTALADASTIASHPNVEAKSRIATTNPSTQVTVFDKAGELKWLWPRLTKAGVLTKTPARSLSGFHVALRKGHGKTFRVGDVVRFREWPVRERPSLDPFAAFHGSSGLIFRVKAQDDDSAGVDLENASGQVVDVASPNPSNPDPRSWTDILASLFRPGMIYALICPRTAAGKELRLVADPVLEHIRTKNGPLNAPENQPAALCVAASSSNSTMSATNLPELSRRPRITADIIGIYEGGSYHDCGVFRPAGRCKMRAAAQKIVPFCHVCRYLLVDRVDPTRHGVLDALYEAAYPQS